MNENKRFHQFIIKNILKITTTHFLWDNSNNIKDKKIIFSPNQVVESTISYSSSSGSS